MINGVMPLLKGFIKSNLSSMFIGSSDLTEYENPNLSMYAKVSSQK